MQNEKGGFLDNVVLELCINPATANSNCKEMIGLGDISILRRFSSLV